MKSISGKGSSEKVQYLFDLIFKNGTGDYIGEEISQLEHSLQAAYLAEQHGAEDDTVVAALLHDVGQILPLSEILDDVVDSQHTTTSPTLLFNGQNVGRVGHETLGEAYLRRLGFKDKICALVGAHVAAKRYLTATDQSYYDSLSDASKKSLALQGGPFTLSEIQSFEDKNPGGLWRDMILLRRWDDGAKCVGLQVPDLASYQLKVENGFSILEVGEDLV